MVKQEHLDLLTQGVEVWNQWREAYLACRLDLSGADLNGFDLSRANLARVNLCGTQLRGANFSGAYLMEADLSRANLSRASFGGAFLLETNLQHAQIDWAKLDKADLSWAILDKALLREADLTRAILRGASLQEADLTRAILSEVDLSEALLREADFTNAHLSRSVFAEIDLCAIKGLIEIDHRGPSIVQIHTVKFPQDSRALHFLRGAGVPNEWIDFYRRQNRSLIQYYSCFISYLSKDDRLARCLYADLQNQGVRCWFAPHNMKIGDKIRPRIDEAIHVQDKVLLILSEHALISAWVEDEVEAALEKEQRHHQEVLFPVRLDDTVMDTSQPWAAKLRRTRHIGNCMNWTDPQAYQTAFDRLLKDLKKTEE